MNGNWQDRIEAIATNLLTLEVNTATKPCMVAQKMPELPAALHSIIEAYRDFLMGKGPEGRDDPLSRELVIGSAAHIAGCKPETGELAAWFDPQSTHPHHPIPEVTNGAETFEALRWAAYGVLDQGSYQRTVKEVEWAKTRMLLQRIRSNSRQLRSAALVLEREYGPDAYPGMFDGSGKDLKCDERLREVVRTGELQAGTGKLRLFGGTVEQTADALFKYPKPVIRFEPDLTLLVRKAWDVGLEEVKMQTVVQLDGDVLVRASEAFAQGERDFLSDLHRQVVREGMSQWKLLFQTVGELVRETGRLLFGPPSR